MTPTPQQILALLREAETASPVDDPDVSIALEVENPLPSNPDHPFMHIAYTGDAGDYEHDFSVDSVTDNDRWLDFENSVLTITDTAGDEVHLVIDLEYVSL